MAYYVHTLWQAEEFLVEIRGPRFDNRALAYAFVQRPKRLVRQGDYLAVYATVHGGSDSLLQIAGDWDIDVYRLSCDREAKRVLTLDDYEPVDLLIGDFAKHPSLRTFGSMSHRIVARHDRSVSALYPIALS